MRLLLKTIAIIFVVWSTNSNSNSNGNNDAKAPNVSVITPTNSQKPTWSWERGGGSKGNKNYRYKLNNGDLTSGATSTTNTNHTPASPLSDGTHTLYVQEQDGDESDWSDSGSAAVVIDSIAPIITSNSAAININENTTAVTTVVVTEANTVTYSISGGADQAKFGISSGVLTFASAPNYENPTDDDTNNTYIVEVTATDAASNADTQTITVTVIDVIETATLAISSIGNANVAEGSIYTSDTPSLTKKSDNPIGDLTYTLSGDDATDFSINSSTGEVSMVPRDYDNPVDSDTNNTYSLSITATDEDGNSDIESWVVTVTDATAPLITGTTVAADNTTIATTFSESVYRNSNKNSLKVGNFSLSLSGGSAFLSKATPSSISISGNVYTLGLSLSGTPNGSETITVVPSSSTAIYDSAGNAASTSQSNNTVNLNDESAPTLSSSTPADNATAIAVDANIVLNFSEAVDVESGNITIKKTSDDSTIEIIDVTSGQVTGTGTTAITINPGSDLSGETEYYVLVDATAFDDSSSNSYVGISSTTVLSFTTADAIQAPGVVDNLPKLIGSYPKVFGKNIGVNSNIILDFDRVVYASNSSTEGRVERFITIYNADTNTVIFNELSNSSYITGSGTAQITINPPSDLEEKVNYYVNIGDDAFHDSDGNYYFGISDANSLNFITAKNPMMDANITALKEMQVNHSMDQVEKSIGAITHRQNFIRRNGGKNNSSQGIKFTFNNQALDDTLNKLAPLVSHFESYDISKQLANAADKALPNDWGLWTAGEIALGNVNSKSGVDSTSKSKEISVGLDKIIGTDRMAGLCYRLNKTETVIGNDGTQMNSSSKHWSAYGSLKTNKHSTLEGLIGWGNISTDHTRVDGANTYTGVQESQQVYASFIAREIFFFEEANLSPFIRIDSSYTKQAAYSETGDSNSANDALHYKSNNIHNTIFSVGVDTDVEYQFGDKTVKPYLSLRHKINTGYESSNEMYYLSNPVKEYTGVIASNSGKSGLNLVIGADIQSA